MLTVAWTGCCPRVASFRLYAQVRHFRAAGRSPVVLNSLPPHMFQSFAAVDVVALWIVFCRKYKIPTSF